MKLERDFLKLLKRPDDIFPSFPGISFPVVAFPGTREVNGGSFVAVVPHPGVIIITNKESIQTVVTNTFRSLLRCWPVIVCISLMAILAGVIFWIIVSRSTVLIPRLNVYRTNKNDTNSILLKSYDCGSHLSQDCSTQRFSLQSKRGRISE